MIKTSHCLALLSFAGCLLTSRSAYGATIGSDTTVNRFNAQQTLATGDRVAGFAWLAGGLALTDATTTATFDSVFPLSGTLALNGGTLILNQNLVMREVVQFTTLGNIIGDGHTLELFPRKIAAGPGEIPERKAVQSASGSRQNAIRAISWSSDDKYVAVGTRAVNGAGLSIYLYDGINTLSLVTTFDMSNKDVNDLAWHPTLPLLAAGRLRTPNSFELMVFQFNVLTNQLTIASNDAFSEDVTALAWHPSGNYLAVGSKASTKEIAVYPVDVNGILGTPAVFNIIPNEDVKNRTISWDPTGKFFAVGMSDLRVFRFDTNPSLSVTAAGLLNIGLSTGVSWHPTVTSLIAVGLQNTAPRLRLIEYNSNNQTFNQLVTESADLDTAICDLEWSPDGNYLALGRDVVNRLGLFRIYSFSKTTTALVPFSSYSFAHNVRAVSWSPDPYAAAGSDVNLFALYTLPGTPTPSGLPSYTWSDLHVIMRDDVLFEGFLTFTGNSTWSGRGNVLQFGSTSTLAVEDGSTLLIQDVTLNSVDTNKIRVKGANGKLTLENVVLALDADYSFTIGSLEIRGDVDIAGGLHSFIYQSAQTSTIAANSRLIVDFDTTLSYASTTTTGTALQFTDNTSELLLRDGTLRAAAYLNLTKGKFSVEGKSSLVNTTTAQTIVFGDGNNSQNNVMIHIEPAAQLIIQGAVVDNNV